MGKGLPQNVGIGHFKIRKIKSRSHGTAHKRKIGAFRRSSAEPRAARDGVLEILAVEYILPQKDFFCGPVRPDYRQPQGRSEIKMPHLVLFQPVQMGIFSPAQEEQDARGEVPHPSETGQGFGGDRSLATICFGEKTAFRMRGHAEMLYQFLRVHRFFLGVCFGGKVPRCMWAMCTPYPIRKAIARSRSGLILKSYPFQGCCPLGKDFPGI